MIAAIFIFLIILGFVIWWIDGLFMNTVMFSKKNEWLIYFLGMVIALVVTYVAYILD